MREILGEDHPLQARTRDAHGVTWAELTSISVVFPFLFAISVSGKSSFAVLLSLRGPGPRLIVEPDGAVWLPSLCLAGEPGTLRPWESPSRLRI